jgi:hypothetical protein
LDTATLQNPYIHLTNNQINKRNAKGPRGGIRTINWTFAQLKKHFQGGGYAAAGASGGSASIIGDSNKGDGDPWDRVWEQTRQVVSDTFRVALDTLETPLSGSGDLGGRQCFELFGLDVLIDAE